MRLADRICWGYVVGAMTIATVTLFVLPAYSDAVRDDLGLSSTQVGLLTTVLVVHYAIWQIPGGLLGATIGIGRAFAVAFALVSVGFVVAAAASSFPALLVSRAVAGCGAGMLLPLGSSLARTVAPTANTRAQGVLGSGWGLGYLLALFLLPIVLDGWRSAFALVAAAAAIASVVALAAIPAGRVTSPRAMVRECREALARRGVWLCGTCLLGMTFLNVGLGAWVSAFLQDDVGLSNSSTAVLTALIGLGLLPASIVGAAMARGGHEQSVVAASCFGLAAVAVAMAVGRPLWLIAVALFGLGWFSAFPFGVVLAYVSASGRAARAETQGILTGAVNGLGFIGGSLAPPLVGVVRDSTGSFALAFLILLVGPAVALAATARTFGREPSSRPVAEPG